MSDWTEQDHADLLADRAANKGWAKCRPWTRTAREKEGRWKTLTAAPLATKPRAKRGPKVDEDGLIRLKGKLSTQQYDEAKRYRDIGRLAQLAGGAVKSGLDFSPTGSQAGGLPIGGGVAFEATHAKREMFRMRYVVLKGQSDAINVLDAVCLNGLTLIAFAGGTGNDRRAGELFAVLRVALDLLRLDRALVSNAGGKSAA